MNDLGEADLFLESRFYRDRIEAINWDLSPSAYMDKFKDISDAELQVDCYYDVGFEIDRDDKKSQTGYVFILNEGAVDWKSS
ncbi:hypothetical protein Tco_0044269 [Tanacetum coccineum]